MSAKFGETLSQKRATVEAAFCLRPHGHIHRARLTVTLGILPGCWASTSGSHAWQQAVFPTAPLPLPCKPDSNPCCLHPESSPHLHHVTSAFPREDWLSGLWTLAQHECGRPTPPLPCLKSLTSYSSFPWAGMAPVHLWQSWSGSPPPPRGVTGSSPPPQAAHKPGLRLLAHHPSTGKVEARPSGVKASQGYRVTWRPAWASLRVGASLGHIGGSGPAWAT